MITKKVFVETAHILKTYDADHNIIKGMADLFAKHNPNFDYDKFYEASQ